MKISLLLALALGALPASLPAQTFQTRYPDIPRIDAHMHVAAKDRESPAAYLALRQAVKQHCGADLALWINVTQADLGFLTSATEGRMLGCFSTYYPAVKGFEHHRPEDLARFQQAGYLGYKVWYGPSARQGEGVRYPYLDDPALEPAWRDLEAADVLLTSLHVADPNGPFDFRTKWAADPVDYWRQISAFERVLHRHPRLRVVAAHGVWLMTQNAQLDYLRYLLATYPNLNIDIAATFQYSNLPSYDNLRDFYLGHQDRIVWGSDNVAALTEKTATSFRKKYVDWFRFLETDEVLSDVTTANKQPMRGLGLPREVLERIYYRNALRLYPPAVAAALQRHRTPSP
jgi:hypothetical protein